MPVQFCTDCGDLLPTTTKKSVACECCGRETQNELLNSVTVSSTSDFPSELRAKRGFVQKPDSVKAADTQATIDVKCPNCRADEVQYTAVQLRSADEGTTIFYSCPKCSTRWNEDN